MPWRGIGVAMVFILFNRIGNVPIVWYVLLVGGGWMEVGGCWRVDTIERRRLGVVCMLCHGHEK